MSNATITKKKAAAKAKTTINKSALPSKVAYYILYVQDMTKAIEFYKSIGLKAGYESAEWTEFNAGIKFALHLGSCGPKSEQVKSVDTSISFGVKNAKETYAAFKALGVKVSGEIHKVCEDGYAFQFEDPFGNKLGIYGG